MFDFLKKFSERKRAERETAQEVYLRLVRKAAEDGDLNEKDTAAIAEAAAQIGIPLDGGERSVASDCAAYVEWLTASREAAGAEQAEATVDKADRAIKSFDNETEQAMKDLREKRDRARVPLASAMTQATATAQRANAARTRAGAIGEAIWYLRGVENPAIERAARSRERFLLHAGR